MRGPSRAALILPLAAACSATSLAPERTSGPRTPDILPDLSISRAPFHDIDVAWKERLGQPYVHLDSTGSYTGIGRLLEAVHQAARDQGIAPAGPPFALYYDDPGLVPVEELRMRACLPVAGAVAPLPPLGFDVLPATTVVYALVAGPYPEVPRAYPGLFAYLEELGWVEDGPVREIYLVDPGTVESWDELVTEVQVPAVNGP
jgi:effector-binding domain-containing protein